MRAPVGPEGAAGVARLVHRAVDRVAYGTVRIPSHPPYTATRSRDGRPRWRRTAGDVGMPDPSEGRRASQHSRSPCSICSRYVAPASGLNWRGRPRHTSGTRLVTTHALVSRTIRSVFHVKPPPPDSLESLYGRSRHSVQRRAWTAPKAQDNHLIARCSGRRRFTVQRDRTCPTSSAGRRARACIARPLTPGRSGAGGRNAGEAGLSMVRRPRPHRGRGCGGSLSRGARTRPGFT